MNKPGTENRINFDRGSEVEKIGQKNEKIIYHKLTLYVSQISSMQNIYPQADIFVIFTSKIYPDLALSNATSFSEMSQ